MRKLFDFRCTNNHTFEAFVEADVFTSRCKCGTEAKRLISPVKCSLDPISGHFPGATDRWAKHHEDMAKAANQQEH